MEAVERKQSSDELDAKPSFRKPSNDASGRNYRRHSPMGGSDASLSDDSAKHGKENDSPREEHSKMSDKKRRHDKIDLDRDRHGRTRRDGDSRRYLGRQPYMTSHSYYRNDRYGRDRRDDYERSYHRSSKFAHDRDHSPRRRKGDFDRSDEVSQKSDKVYRDRSDDGHRSDDKIVDHSASRGSDAALSRSRKTNSRKEDEEAVERDRHRDRQSRDDRREHCRSPEDRKSHYRSYDRVRSRLKDSRGRDLDEHEEMLDKRKCDRKDYDKDRNLYDKESEKHARNHNSRSSSHQEQRLKNASDEDDQGLKGHASPWKKKSNISEGLTEDAKILNESKSTSEAENPNTSSSIFSLEPSIPSIGQVGTVNHGAATVAAMRAAEIVNRNIMGGGLSITEQKRKLLWGNKKSTEESSSQWDLSMFTDRERQEKFRKLMGVKGDVKLETKSDDKGNLRAKKQEELQMDLEKQYTAGLRRRDGRTVGLGL